MVQNLIGTLLNRESLIGNFKNPGTEWCQKEEPVEVRMHDFVDPIPNFILKKR